jgi:large subunit ribosomal protein L4
MKLTVKDNQGQDQGELEVKLQLIENQRGTQAVHDTVVAHMANQRMGTACTKTVGEVAGSNKKPWRQKGTGRARAGSFQSPLWVGGGVVFGPRPRDFGKKVNRKTRQLALLKALSERLKAGDVLVVGDLKLAAPKTKTMVALLDNLKISGTVLIVLDPIDNNVILASRNIPCVDVVTGEELNTYQVLKSDKLIFTRSAFAKVEARLE